MLGAILIIIAIFVGVSSDMFRRLPNQKHVLGKIVAINQLYALTPDNLSAQTIVEYAVQGVKYKTSVTNKQYHKAGKRLLLAYDAEKPNSVIVRPSSTTYSLVVIFTVGGIALLLSYVFGGF